MYIVAQALEIATAPNELGSRRAARSWFVHVVSFRHPIESLCHGDQVKVRVRRGMERWH
jgi:hypothetical protein